VSIQDDFYAPARETVPLNSTVTWTNNGSIQHTVTSDDGKFNSGVLDPGDTASFTFAAPGRYPYHCMFHGAPGGVGMSGVITVT
jgi:plastocyanin